MCIRDRYKNESGHFIFDGLRLAADAPHKAAEVGIARTFQNIRLFGNMTAIENVMVGRHLRTHAGVFGAISRNSATRTEEAAITRRAEELLHYVGIHERAHDYAKHLSYGDQRRLEIARALATEPKLLALDEPAAGMNGTETEALRLLVEGICRDGVTVLLIEHDVKPVSYTHLDVYKRQAYGQGLADEVEKAAKANGATIVAREFTNDKATDFKAILTKIKAKNPDVIFLGGMDAVGGPMLKQMKELGIKAKFTTGDGGCSPELIKLAGPASEGVILSLIHI